VTNDITYAGRLFNEDELQAFMERAMERCAAGPWVPIAAGPIPPGVPVLTRFLSARDGKPAIAVGVRRDGHWFSDDEFETDPWAVPVTHWSELKMVKP